MKVLKKFAGMILAVCLMVPMIGTVAFAAEGVLMFSDPTAKVGDNVNIDLVVQSNNGQTVGDVQVNMTYDPASLEFVSGEGFTADGSGALSFTGTGNGAELRETMTFRALKTGAAKISVSGTTASMADGETLTLREGSSTVTVNAADDGTTSVEPSQTTSPAGETTDIVVTVNGTDYNFSEAFTGNDIPEGYSETTLTFNGEDRKFVANEAGVTLGYLVDSSGTGSFFLFNTEDATFSPYIDLSVSDTTSIVPLSNADSVTLPDTYQQVELTVQDQQYPAWSDPMASRYYVIYALNTRTGESGLYRYDTEDGTYQYFTAPTDDTEEDSSGTALPGTLGELIGSHLMIVLVVVAVIILILLILIIIFAVKLVHRNQELDDLYDEYDIPYGDEDEEEKKEVKSSGKKNKKALEEPEDEEDDDYDEYEDDGYEDDYDDDEEDDDYDDDEEDDDYDDYDDDYDEEPVTSTAKKDGRKKNSSSEDDYNINFIDL